MKIAMHFEGGTELAASLRAMPEAASATIVVGALHQAGLPMADNMASLMKRSKDGKEHAADHVVVSRLTWRIEVDGITRSILPGEYAVGVGPAKDFFYWFFQEYGTVYQQPPNPALRPGFDQTVEQSLGILIALMRDAIAAKAREVGP